MLPREALDPEIREAVRDIPDFVFSVETVPMMRQNAVFSPVAAPDIARTELTTEPVGGVSMTVLRPRDAVGNLPVLFWMHGGGMVIGNRYMDDSRLGEWCRSLSCVCISVEYRLAPEAPYPLPLDDCDEGLRYVIDHAGDLGINPRRIGVAGRSHDNAKRRAAIPFQFDGVERAVDCMFEYRQQIRLQARHDRLGFWIAHAAIEFQCLCVALVIDHQAGVQKAGEMAAVFRHAMDGGDDDFPHHACM